MVVVEMIERKSIGGKRWRSPWERAWWKWVSLPLLSLSLTHTLLSFSLFFHPSAVERERGSQDKSSHFAFYVLQ